MKLKYFLFLIFVTQTLLKEERKAAKKNKTEEIKETKETEEINEIFNEEEGYYTWNKIHELNDVLFDQVIRGGRIYRWLIIFYSKTCVHCMKAKKEIKKLFDKVKRVKNETLRFAQMEAYDNSLTNVRFNISGVPYIIVVENNSMFEMNLFPNYDNLKTLIETNFTEVKDELKPIPKRVRFQYVAWVVFRQAIGSITDAFNIALKKKRNKYKI